MAVAAANKTSKKVVNGYSHAPALPCELATWNDDEHIYIDMLDPNAIFSIFFTDVLVSEDMQDPVFAEAITALPVAVKSEIKTVVYKALDAAGLRSCAAGDIQGSGGSFQFGPSICNAPARISGRTQCHATRAC